MVYVNKLILPGEKAESNVVSGERRTCFTTFYPFNIFPKKELRTLEFDNITMLCGGNGSGKSTLINILARKTEAQRFSDHNGAPFFEKYVDMCSVDLLRYPPRSCVLASDDVFDYVLNARYINGNIDERRNALLDKYVSVHKEAMYDPEISRLKGLHDYERWKEIRDILSPKVSQSKFIKKRVEMDIDLYSNGETALKYFVDRIDEEGLYLLDEPENSLSVEFQIELAQYISSTARATGSQFIIATHSPILLSMKGARIYDLDAFPASTCSWTELSNVRRYFDFFMEHKDEFE